MWRPLWRTWPEEGAKDTPVYVNVALTAAQTRSTGLHYRRNPAFRLGPHRRARCREAIHRRSCNHASATAGRYRVDFDGIINGAADANGVASDGAVVVAQTESELDLERVVLPDKSPAGFFWFFADSAVDGVSTLRVCLMARNRTSTSLIAVVEGGAQVTGTINISATPVRFAGTNELRAVRRP